MPSASTEVRDTQAQDPAYRPAHPSIDPASAARNFPVSLRSSYVYSLSIIQG